MERVPGSVQRPGHVTSRGRDADDRLVYTVSESAELLGISRAFAYELVARGELPVIRLGRRRLIPKRALLAIVELEYDYNTTDLLPRALL